MDNDFKKYKNSLEAYSKEEIISVLNDINSEISKLEDKKRAVNQIICEKGYYQSN